MRMAEEGADIVGVDLCAQVATVEYPMATPDDLVETVKLVEDTGRRIVARQADVRDRGALRAALEDGIAELGRVDIAVANAGIGMLTARPDQDPERGGTRLMCCSPAPTTASIWPAGRWWARAAAGRSC